MENLHRDILDNILSRLPNKSILHFKLVCKTWRALLVNKTGLLYSDFFYYCRGRQLEIQFHYGKDSGHLSDYNENNLKQLQHGYFRLTSTTSAFMVGSCNGLVCLEELHEYKGLRSRQVISICNPFTGEFISLPGSRKLNLLQEDSAVGFGYIPATNEYKIVRIHYTMANEGRVQVYTLGSNLGWRNVGRIPFFLPLLRDIAVSPLFGVFANGAVYWWVDQGGVEYKIVAFNLTTEKFISVPSPSFIGHVQPRLLLLGEDLCLVLKNVMYDWIDIWVFQKKKGNGATCEAKEYRNERYYDHHQEYYYDNIWSWSKEYSSIPFCQAMEYEPFTVTNKNEVLLLCCKASPRQIYSYNPKTLALEKLGDCYWSRAIPHMNSFVSLKAMGECSIFREMFCFFKRFKRMLRVPGNKY